MPVNPQLVQRELEGQKAQNGCRETYDDTELRRAIEVQLRLQSAVRQLVGEPAKSSDEDAFNFFNHNRDDFADQNLIEAAHIVVHVNEGQSEVEARSRIEEVSRALELGMPFSSAASLFSDCPGDGNLGVFLKGDMVPEFEAAILSLKPGERTGIFRTPFGFHIAELRSLGAPASAFRLTSGTIKQFLDFEKTRCAYEAAADMLRARAKIVYLNPDSVNEPDGKL